MFRDLSQPLSRSLVVGSTAIAVALLLQGIAAAQRPVGIPVQLPTVTVFNVNTVVSVPDGGTLSLGGVTRQSARSSTSGFPGLAGPLSRPFSNRSFGVSNSASQASIKVRILSSREMSEDVLAAARASRPANYEAIQAQKRKADFLTRNIGRSSNQRRR